MNNVDVTDKNVFEAARQCGAADKTSEGRIAAFAQTLRVHLIGKNYEQAIEWFRPVKNSNNHGVMIRRDVLNGYCAGRGWGEYELLDNDQKSAARKFFSRAVERCAPKPAKEKTRGGQLSPEVATANSESNDREVKPHDRGMLSGIAGTINAFVNGPLDEIFEALRASNSVAGGRMAAWQGAIAATKDATKALVKHTGL